MCIFVYIFNVFVVHCMIVNVLTDILLMINARMYGKPLWTKMPIF